MASAEYFRERLLNVMSGSVDIPLPGADPKLHSAVNGMRDDFGHVVFRCRFRTELPLPAEDDHENGSLKRKAGRVRSREVISNWNQAAGRIS
jgi:hypothetical protein